MTPFTSSRRLRVRVLIWVATIAITAVAAQAWGQTSSGAEWRRGTVLGGFAGAASAAGTKAAVGTALGWEIIPHLTLEGRGVWLPDDTGSTDFVAWLGALVPVLPAGVVVPFVSGGLGMYRTTVDAAAADMPEFYQRRMNNRQRAIFQDVAVGFGGGANMFLTPHFAIRPEVTVLLVTTRAEMRTVALYGVQLAYHFEPHKTR